MILKRYIGILLITLFLAHGTFVHATAFQSEKLSLQFDEIDIQVILRSIAEFTGRNIITSEAVTGKITIHLQDIPWEEALDIILKTKGLAKREIDNTLWIAPTEEILNREKWEWETAQQQETRSLLHTEHFCLNHIKAAQLAMLLKADKNNFLSVRGAVFVDERTNSLIVQDNASKLALIKQIIEQLDVPVRQVLIESRIVFVMNEFEKALGVAFSSLKPHLPLEAPMAPESDITEIQTRSDWSNRLNVHLPVALSSGALNMASLGWTLAKLPGGTLLDLELMALENEGLGKIISSPRLVTSNQQQAYIESGEEIPYQEVTASGATSVAFKKAVLRLEVTPQITLDNHILLDLKVNQDSRGIVTNGVPAINTREMATRVLIADGETIVLGGIYQHHKTRSKMRVPFLGKLPLLGWLFRNQSRRFQKNTLLIFVTPHIIGEEKTLD